MNWKWIINRLVVTFLFGVVTSFLALFIVSLAIIGPVPGELYLLPLFTIPLGAMIGNLIVPGDYPYENSRNK